MRWLLLLAVVATWSVNRGSASKEELSCTSCGSECEAACGTRHFRVCCFHFLRKRSSSVGGNDRSKEDANKLSQEALAALCREPLGKRETENYVGASKDLERFLMKHLTFLRQWNSFWTDLPRETPQG